MRRAATPRTAPRRAASRRPAPPRAGRAFPRRAGLSPLPAWERREASHLPRGDDETIQNDAQTRSHAPCGGTTFARQSATLGTPATGHAHSAPRTLPRPRLVPTPPATPADSTRRPTCQSVDPTDTDALARTPPARRRKMRLLTLVSLAKGSKELSYASVAAGLQVEASGARPAR